MSSVNFPPNGEYVGTLCHVVKTSTQSGQPALLIRFAVQHDDLEYSPTAFWSFSNSASKYIRQRCSDIGIKYGDIESVRKQLMSKVGCVYLLDIQNASNGFQQLQFVPAPKNMVDEVDARYLDFEDADDDEDDVTQRYEVSGEIVSQKAEHVDGSVTSPKYAPQNTHCCSDAMVIVPIQCPCCERFLQLSIKPLVLEK